MARRWKQSDRNWVALEFERKPRSVARASDCYSAVINAMVKGVRRTSSGATTQRVNLATEQDRLWVAIVARDRAADGTCYDSGRTTGVCSRR